MEIVFPLYWVCVPIFLNYWMQLKKEKKELILRVLIFGNFFYASIQLFLLKFFNYSLVFHRPGSEYVIPNYVQNSVFQYIGLNWIHDSLKYIGGGVTGLFGERVNFICLCIVILFTFKVFYKNRKSFETYISRRYHKLAVLFALFFLLVSGSSLSFWLVLFPVFFLIFYYKCYFLWFPKVVLVKTKTKTTLSTGIYFLILLILIFLCLGFFFWGYPQFSEIVSLVDSSGRLRGLFSASDYIAGSNKLSLNILFGWGLIPTSMIGDPGLARLLPEGLQIGLSSFGYLFTSYGLFGLSAFIIGYVFLLWKYTVLSIGSAILLSGVFFMAIGSPIHYNYIYALLILSPQEKFINN